MLEIGCVWMCDECVPNSSVYGSVCVCERERERERAEMYGGQL